MPEKGNTEQKINGYFLNDCGGGICVPMPRLDTTLLREFLAKAPQYQLGEDQRRRLDALPTVLQELNRIFMEKDKY
uniref:Uncharacterized protein n=1 Tax=Candidatus Kentrum sp. FW TaxID=2126338 RepID=A0A450U4Q7_9GAMM|nr:MAG: hypothetical protein BECKFW1821C_GA0114237_12251 [Candidatus Kentron sp. FW]